MFSWFKKKKTEKTDESVEEGFNSYWHDKDIIVNDEKVKFENHFYVNANRDICIQPSSSILKHPLFSEIQFGKINLEAVNLNNHTLAEAFSISRSIYHEYIYSNIDNKLVNEILKDTQSIIDGLESLIKNEYNDKALFDNPYVESSIYIRRSSYISVNIKPYQVDAYINYLKEHNYTEYIDEYRKYIIEQLANEVKNNVIEFDQPTTNISLYTKWKTAYVELLERNKKNEEYKQIISEISAVYSAGKR